MKLSVVIVSYNVEEILNKCLESLERSVINIEHEIYVVDNNSIDNSTELIRKKYPNVKLIANSKNVGFSKANNQALKKVKGKYVLILNPDTILLPDTLKKMVSFMDESDGKTAIATCKVELPNGEIDKDCRRSFPTPWTAFTHFSNLSKVFKGSKMFDSYYMGFIPDSKESEVDSCVGAFMMIKQHVLGEVGLFDEDYFFYGEDLDLCYRVRQKGYKIIYTPITKIVHHKGASSGIKKHSAEISKSPKESRKKAIVESTRAMELFYKKHYVRKYPIFVTLPILAAISALKSIRLFKLYYL